MTTAREKYQAERVERHRLFAGGITSYMASASYNFSNVVKKKYLQYFLADRAIVSVYKNLYCKKFSVKYGCVELESLRNFDHHSFIDSLTDAEILDCYQLHHGDYQSQEYIAAGILFEEKARCSFQIDLASTVQHMLNKKIDRPLEKIREATSWNCENQNGEIDHPEKFKTKLIKAGPRLVIKDNDIDAKEFEDFEITEQEIQEAKIKIDESQSRRREAEGQLRKSKMESIINAKDLQIEYKDEEIEFSRKKRNFDDYNNDCKALAENCVPEVCVYSPPNCGKSTYANGRYGYLFDTDELFYTEYSSKILELGKHGIISNRVEFGRKAKKSIAIVPSKRKFIERLLMRGIRPGAMWYKDILDELHHFTVVKISNQSVASALEFI